MSFVKATSIDDAIQHCLDVVEEKKNKADKYDRWDEWESVYADECIQCATDYQQLAEWLTELKQWRRVYGICPSYEMCIPECREGYDAQIAEYKRLLKLAVEDFAVYGALKDLSAEQRVQNPDWRRFNRVFDVLDHQWRYADETLKLIGDESNGI